MHQPATAKQLRGALIFTGAYLALSAVVILVRRDLEFLLYLVVMALIITAVLGVYRRAGLSWRLLWCFSIWGLMHMIGGLVPIPDGWQAKEGTSAVVYNLRLVPIYLKYDQVVHGYGVGLVTWLVWQALSTRVRSHDGGHLRPTFGMMALCATAGMGFGALNEVVEFFASLTLPHTNIGGYLNTGWDLVSNLAGATIAGTAIFFLGKTVRFGPAADTPAGENGT